MLHFNFPWDGAGPPGALLFIVIIYGLFWLLTLGFALTRVDLDPVTRFMWVFVVVSVPVIGVLFYVLLCPPRPSPISKRPRDPLNPLSGTPWENNPDHTRQSGD
jgi:hypothetical protein